MKPRRQRWKTKKRRIQQVASTPSKPWRPSLGGLSQLWSKYRSWWGRYSQRRTLPPASPAAHAPVSPTAESTQTSAPPSTEPEVTLPAAADAPVSSTTVATQTLMRLPIEAGVTLPAAADAPVSSTAEATESLVPPPDQPRETLASEASVHRRKRKPRSRARRAAAVVHAT